MKRIGDALTPQEKAHLETTLTTLNQKLDQGETLTFTEKMRESLENVKNDIMNITNQIQKKLENKSKKLGKLPEKLKNTLIKANIIIKKQSGAGERGEAPNVIRKKIASVLQNSLTIFSTRLNNMFSNMPSKKDVLDNIGSALTLLSAGVPGAGQLGGKGRRQYKKSRRVRPRKFPKYTRRLVKKKKTNMTRIKRVKNHKQNKKTRRIKQQL